MFQSVTKTNGVTFFAVKCLTGILLSLQKTSDEILFCLGVEQQKLRTYNNAKKLYEYRAQHLDFISVKIWLTS
uniref:Uncharacterized protein n=1 Tax=Romanomermis culicivorax TaxID=13658 RepID=A0A915IVU5_ROMCU